MREYILMITRTRVDVGYVTVEAKDEEDAIRRYFRPNEDEDLIMDDEIDWDWDEGKYEAEVCGETYAGEAIDDEIDAVAYESEM